MFWMETENLKAQDKFEMTLEQMWLIIILSNNKLSNSVKRNKSAFVQALL